MPQKKKITKSRRRIRKLRKPEQVKRKAAQSMVTTRMKNMIIILATLLAFLRSRNSPASGPTGSLKPAKALSQD